MNQKDKKNNFFSGKNSCISIINGNKRHVFKIMIQDDKYNEFINIIPEKYRNIIEKTSKNKLDKYSSHQSHQGIVLSCSNQINNENALENILRSEESRIMMLEDVQDPHNVGAIIRTSYCMNFDGVFLSKNMPEINNTIVRTSAGYSESIDVFCDLNFSNFILKLKKFDYFILGLDIKGIEIDLNSEEFKKINQRKKIAIILGSEGSGMKDLTKKSCDCMLKIKIKDGSDSLNVSNAAAIIAYGFQK